MAVSWSVPGGRGLVGSRADGHAGVVPIRQWFVLEILRSQVAAAEGLGRCHVFQLEAARSEECRELLPVDSPAEGLAAEAEPEVDEAARRLEADAPVRAGLHEGEG